MVDVVKKIYGFIGLGLKCRPLTWVINLNAPNFSSNPHLFLDFGLIIPNPKP